VPIVDPHSWEVLVFGDQTAWQDFLGAHSLWHHQLADTIRSLGGTAYPTLPLGDGGGEEWHFAHQQHHDGAADALLIDFGPDLRSYNLTEPQEFASWCWVHAQESIRLRRIIGF
jgi:hypothetical protein